MRNGSLLAEICPQLSVIGWPHGMWATAAWPYVCIFPAPLPPFSESAWAVGACASVCDVHVSEEEKGKNPSYSHVVRHLTGPDKHVLPHNDRFQTQDMYAYSLYRAVYG